MSSATPDPAAPPGLRTDAEARRPGDPTDEILADGAAGRGPAPDAAAAPGRLAGREHRPVLVVDHGAQYAQLIARRVRGAKFCPETVPHDPPVERLLGRGPA